MVTSSGGTYSLTAQIRVVGLQQLDQITSSLQRTDQAAKTTNASVTQTGQGFQRLGQQVQTSNAPLQNFGQGITTVQQRSQQLVGTQSALGNAFRQTGTAVQGTAGGLTQYNTMLGTTGQQTATLKQRLGELGSSFAGVAGSITGVVASGVMMVQTIGSIITAQRNLDRSNLQVQFRQQRTAVRQAHVNRLQAQGKENTEQYRLALSQLALTQERERQTLLRNADAQGRYNLAMANMAGTVLPAAAIMIGSLTSTISQLTAKNAEGITGITRLSNAFKALLIPSLASTATAAPAAATGIAATGTASTAAAGGIGRLGAAFKGLMISMGPPGWAMIAIGAALTVIHTNAFGARDGLDSVGKAIGDISPELGVLGEGIRDVAETLGIVPDNGRSAADALAELENQMRETGEEADKTGTFFENLIEKFGETDLVQQLSAGLSQIPGLFDQYIIQPITNIGNIIFDAFSDFGQLIMNAIEQNFPDLIPWVADNIIAPINDFPQHLINLGEAIWNEFGDIVGQMGQWVVTNIVEPINGFVDQLTDFGIEILNRLGNIAGEVKAWAETNIINPIVSAWEESLEAAGLAEWWDAQMALGQEIQDQIHGNISAQDEATESAEAFIEVLAVLKKDYAELVSQSEKGTVATKGLGGALAEAAGFLDESAESQEKYNAMMQLINAESAIFESRIAGINTILQDNVSNNQDAANALGLVSAAVVDISSGFDELDPVLQAHVDNVLKWASETATASEAAQVLQAAIGDGVVPAFVNGLEPALQANITAFINWAQEVKEAGVEFDSISDMINAFVNSGGLVPRVLEDMTTGMNDVGRAIILTGGYIVDSNSLFKEMTDLIDHTGEAVDTLATKLGTSGLAGSFKFMGDTLAMSIGEGEDAINDFLTKDQLLTAAIDKQATSLEIATGLWDWYINGFEQAGFSVEQYIDILGKLGLKDKDTIDIIKEMGKAREEGIEKLEEEGEAIEDVTVSGKEYVTVTGRMAEANAKLTASLNEKVQGIKDESLMQELVTQGTLEAQDAILKYGEEILKNRTYLEEWGNAINSATFEQAAFEKGQQDQIAALQASQVAILENAGALDTYTEQVISGEAGQLAFIRGVQDQREALLDSIVALEEARGGLEEYTAQIALGIPQGVAFTEGQQEMSRALLDSEVNMANVAGQLVRLNQSLGDTTDRLVRFTEGWFEGALAASEFVAEIDKASGAFVGYRSGLEDAAKAAGITLPEGINISNESLEKQIALARGSAEAFSEFAQSINEAAKAAGDQFAQSFGEDFDLSNIKNEIDEFANSWETLFGVKMPETVKEFSEKLSTDSTIRQALEEQIDTFLAAVGTKGPELEQQGQFLIDSLRGGMEKASPQMQAQMQALMTTIEEIMACNGCPEAVAKFEEQMKTLGDVMSTEAEGIKQTAKGIADALITEFGRSAEAVDQLLSKLKEISEAKLGPGVDPRLTEILSQSQALDEADTLGPGAREQIISGGESTAGPTIDTSAATQALQQLQVLATATIGRIVLELNKLGPAMTTAVGQMNQAFSSVAETLPAVAMSTVGQINLAFSSIGETLPQIIATTVESVNTQLQTLAQGAQQAVGQMNLAFSSIGQTWPQIVAAAIAAINAQLATLSQGVVTAVGQMNLAFSSIQQTWPSIMASTVSSVIAQLNALGSATQQVATQMQQSMTAAAQAMAAAVQQAVSQVVAALGQIGSAAQQAASQVQSAASTMGSALQGVISHANSVADAIRAIGSAADSARSAVNQLASAINSLQDRTITITTRFETIGSPPAGAAGGLGTYEGQVYMARGSGGVSGQGFAPVVIDHPTKLTVGESGPELVSVTPINRNRNSRTGEISPFANMSINFAKGTGGNNMQGAGSGMTITTQSVVFDANQGPIQVINQGGGTGGGGLQPGSAGSPLGTGGFGGTSNVPGVSVSGNAVACVNGECFGNMNGFGPSIGAPGTSTGTTGEQQGFEPVRDETGAIKAIDTLIEWFKFLGLPTGASVPGTGNFTPGTGTISGTGAFAQAGQGAFAGHISMQGGQIVFDSNQGKMDIDTTTGAISIGQGGAFAQAGGTVAKAGGGVGIFGDQTSDQLTQLNKTMQNVSTNMQAVGNAMAAVGDQVVFGNQQAAETFQGINTNLQGLTTTTQQGFQGFTNQIINGVNLSGSGGAGFQGFTLPGGQQGGAVGAGGASGDPLGFLGSMLGGFGINNPFSGAVPTGGAGGVPTTGGLPGGTTGGTGGTGGCNVCGAANGLQGAATDLSGAANQLGNVMTNGNGVGSAFPSGGVGGGLPNGGAGTPTTGGGFPAGGGGGDCACSCMPMDTDTNRFKIEDPSGRDCVNNQYFNTMAECESRLNEVHAASNCGGNGGPTPTPAPTPTGGMGGVSAFAQGGMAMATAGGATAIAGGPGMGGGLGGGLGTPLGNPPMPPRIVQTAGLPSQHPSVDQDPDNWRIVQSLGMVGTFDIVDKSGDVVMLGFRTVTAAQEYLDYFVSYYKWVKSGSNGITGGLGGGIPTGQSLGGAFASVGGGGGTNFSNQIPGGMGGIPTGNTGGLGGLPTGGAPGGTTEAPPTPPPINILPEDATTPTSTTADKINPANVDASKWRISEATRPDGKVVFFVVITEPELTLITETPFATRQDAQNYIDYWRAYQLFIANPPQTFPSQTVPNTTDPGGLPQPGGGMNVGGGGVQAIAGMGGAFAQAGNATAMAGNFLGGGGMGASQRKLGPTPVAIQPFEEIPRPQGPFRSGQDNQEPIFDNSRVKIGADVGDPGQTVSMKELEEGGDKKPRKISRLQRHINTALAIAGDHPAWVDAFMAAMQRMFGDIVLNLAINANLDGTSIFNSQKKHMLKNVSVFS